jgi:hypothetical protein
MRPLSPSIRPALESIWEVGSGKWAVGVGAERAVELSTSRREQVTADPVGRVQHLSDCHLSLNVTSALLPAPSSSTTSPRELGLPRVTNVRIQAMSRCSFHLDWSQRTAKAPRGATATATATATEVGGMRARRILCPTRSAASVCPVGLETRLYNVWQAIRACRIASTCPSTKTDRQTRCTFFPFCARLQHVPQPQVRLHAECRTQQCMQQLVQTARRLRLMLNSYDDDDER